jgi:hypothetical protein
MMAGVVRRWRDCCWRRRCRIRSAKRLRSSSDTSAPSAPTSACRSANTNTGPGWLDSTLLFHSFIHSSIHSFCVSFIRVSLLFVDFYSFCFCCCCCNYIFFAIETTILFVCNSRVCRYHIFANMLERYASVTAPPISIDSPTYYYRAAATYTARRRRVTTRMLEGTPAFYSIHNFVSFFSFSRTYSSPFCILSFIPQR